jgi:hypothetical protein
MNERWSDPFGRNFCWNRRQIYRKFAEKPSKNTYFEGLNNDLGDRNFRQKQRDRFYRT